MAEGKEPRKLKTSFWVMSHKKLNHQVKEGRRGKNWNYSGSTRSFMPKVGGKTEVDG